MPVCDELDIPVVVRVFFTPTIRPLHTAKDQYPSG